MHGRARDVRPSLSRVVALDAPPVARRGRPERERRRHVSGRAQRRIPVSVDSFNPEAVTRVVVRAPNWLGDAVMALPAMAAVRRTFPRSTLAVAALPSIAPMFQETTSAAPDEVIEVERRSETATLRHGRF